MKNRLSTLEQGLGRPMANISFAMMQTYLHSAQRRGLGMMHTARPFSLYCKMFYRSQSKSAVLKSLEGKRIIDVGCGYTPYAEDSMFRACHNAGIEFYGVDPLIHPDIKIGFRERALARATGGSGHFNDHPPGLSKALSARAQELPFDDQSVDEILSSYLLFVWIEDEEVLADILGEFQRVLKPGGRIKLFPLYEWRLMRFKNKRLKNILANFKIEQSFVHGGLDWRVMPSMLTQMTKLV
ncbi:MAG: SAM-dependent methyltransferase [Halioglobus sp.]|jgi:SAM-dependent methyltransferase